MRINLCLLITVLTVLGLQSSTAFSAPSMPMSQYWNDRYDFSFSYPSAIFTSSRVSDNDDGVTLTSTDGSAAVLAYGSRAPEVLNENITALYAEAQTQATGSVTYKTLNLKSGFFVISGLDGDQVFYTKSFVQDGVQKTVEMHYPVNEKSFYDGLTTQIVASFIPTPHPAARKPTPIIQRAPVAAGASASRPTAAPSFQNFRASCYAGPYTSSGFPQCSPQNPGDIENAFSKAQDCAIVSARTACRAAGYSSCSYIGVESSHEAGTPMTPSPGAPPPSSTVCYVNVIVQGR